MIDDDDVLIVVEDETAPPAPDQRLIWKVAVIDDDPAVHDGTRFALYDYSLAGYGIQLLSAYSAEQGRQMMLDHPDIAVVLLDVVMESDRAGLDLVNIIRRELKNETVRIILRTGQPGQAPEREVIVDYDINDYKAKTELTSAKLFTSLTAALRSYQQLKRMEETRRGLEIIIDAASTLYDFRSVQRLAEGVLTQIASLLGLDCAGILVLREGERPEIGYSVLAGSGCYSDLVGRKAQDHLATPMLARIDRAFSERKTDFRDDYTLLYVGTESGTEVVVLLDSGKQPNDTDRSLIGIFCSRFSLSLDNVVLYERLQEANRMLEHRVAVRTEELNVANRRLHDQWQHARRANAVKSEILGTVAHDLKNPLSVIMGRAEIMADLIGRTPFPAPQGLAQVQQIQSSSRRLADMADSLIADAMADAMDISVKREPGDIARLCYEVVETNLPLAERKRQDLRFNAEPGLVALIDIDRLRDALDNLVSNAIKYTPFGGRVEVSVFGDGRDGTIRVADTGPGLTADDHSRIFGRFQRLSAKPTGGESSTGLGLSIAHRIVSLHDGTIQAHSPGAGLGSTFTVRLPLAPIEVTP